MAYQKKLFAAVLIVITVTSACASESFGQVTRGAQRSAIELAMHRAIEKEVAREEQSREQTDDIFWRRLKENNVTILEVPEFTKGTGCHEEWSVHGNLCEMKSLTAFAERENQQLHRAAKRMANNIFTFQKVISRAVHLTLKFKQENVRASMMHNNYVKAFSGLASGELKELLERIKKNQETSQLKSCWRKIATLRSSGLCAICSGRHASFIEDERVLISQETCNDFLSGCADSFRLITDFVVVAQNVSKALRNKPRKASFDVLRNYSSSINRIAVKITQKDISRMIVNYLRRRDTAMSVELCTKLISISKYPIAWKLAKLLSQFNFSKLRITNQYLSQSLSRRTTNSSSNWNKQATAKQNRMLSLTNESLPELPKVNFTNDSLVANSSNHLGSNSSCFFVGDVKVQASIDSSYTSYFGANGTAGNEVSAGKRHLPLNLTNTFP